MSKVSSMIESEKHLLCIAFYIEGTGLTRVISELIQQFQETHTVHLLGVGYSGPVLHKENCYIYPTNLEGGDVMGSYQARQFILDRKPDAVFILQDAWHFTRYMDVLSDVRKLTKIVGYVPIDGRIENPVSILSLAKLDALVLYTHWAKREVSEALSQSIAKSEFPQMAVIGHAVDRDTFFPLPERSEVRKSIFPSEAEDGFIILNASRPCIRKRIDLTLKAFAQFVKNKPLNVKLCLHHAITEMESAQLSRLIAQLGIEDRVLLNPLSINGQNVLTNEKLNELYNACDVGINSSMGEGWGLVSQEHAATGAAQIVPNHTACTELWKGSALLVSCQESTIGQISPFVMTEPILSSLAAAMERLYSDHDIRKSAAQKCMTRVQGYTWSAIGLQWRAIFENLYKSEKSVC